MFILDPEMMKKTFLMGENGTNFTHKSAQHIKLFPFTANNTATIITSFSAVIGEWLRLACNQNKVPESMEATLSKLADSMDDIGAYEKEQLLQIARSIYWEDDEKHSLRPKSITAMCYIPCDDQTALKTAQYLYSVLADNEKLSNVVNQAAEHAIKEVNVLEKAVFEALQAKIEPPAPIDPYYIVHLAPQKIFMEDLKFILKNTARTKEYLVDLLEFSLALSLRKGPLQEEDFKTNNLGRELNRQTITGDADALYKCLFEVCAHRHMSDEEYFPGAVKAHLDRGAVLLQNELRYSGNDFLQHLSELDKSI